MNHTNYTAEAWIYPTSVSGVYKIFVQSEDGDDNWNLYQWDDEFALWCTSGGSAGARFNSTSSPITINTWQHVALVKDGNDYELFVGGSSVATATDSTTDTLSAPLYIGHDSSNQDFLGYMDEIRISDSARYTTTFTPSTTEFTADANTKLLIHSNWNGGIGGDSSGNYNDFTVTNLVSNDVVLDSPTNNFATMNPLDNYYQAASFSEGNLEVVTSSTTAITAANTSTIKLENGKKWYWEVYCGPETSPTTPGWLIGFCQYVPSSALDWIGGNVGAGASTSYSYSGYDGKWYFNNVSTDDGAATYTTGDTIGMALDLENNNWYWHKNGVWMNNGVPTSGATGTNAVSVISADYFVAVGDWDNTNNYNYTFIVNFGQDSSFASTFTPNSFQDANEIGAFKYVVPEEYLALCTSNLSDPEIADPTAHFNTVLWTGDDAASRDITGVGFQPDMVDIKNRTSAFSWVLGDAVRGDDKFLATNGTGDEETDDEKFRTFVSDGFQVGDHDGVNH